MIRDTLTWAARASAVTALVLLIATMIARPLFSWAQSEGAGTARFPQADEAPPPSADDGAPRSNLEAMVPGDPSAPGVVPDESVLAIASPGSPLVIPAADFSSDGAFPDDYFFDFETGFLRGDGFACLKAPAYLPHGVTVDYVGASLYDDYESGNVTVNLKRVNVVSGEVNIMAALGTPWDDTDIQNVGDYDIEYAEISYPTYAYFLTICLSSPDHRLYSVRIYYTEP